MKSILEIGRATHDGVLAALQSVRTNSMAPIKLASVSTNLWETGFTKSYYTINVIFPLT